jgi:hypothetical protein
MAESAEDQPSGSEIVRNQFLDFRHINLCSALHTLRMFLCANKINDAGAQALAMLKDSTTLGTLSLRCNEIGLVYRRWRC